MVTLPYQFVSETDESEHYFKKLNFNVIFEFLLLKFKALRISIFLLSRRRPYTQRIISGSAPMNKWGSRFSNFGKALRYEYLCVFIGDG